MSGLPNPDQVQPLNPEAYRHHLLLLKSLHSGRPVRYRGLNKFINGLTFNQSGCDIQLTVYLSGATGGIDGSEIQIKHAHATGAAPAINQSEGGKTV